MKKYGTLIALTVAIVFGILAVILANQWLSTRAASETVIVKEQVPLGKIVIAGKDLEMGTVLSESNLALAEWPKANIPKGAFTDIKAVTNRIPVRRLTAGLPVLSAELAAVGSGAGLVALIHPGMRAMAIRVDEVIGVGGFILPNTFVDVISVEGKVAKTVLESVAVLAIAQETFVEEGKAKLVRTVTLELEPKQAEKLAETTSKGAIHLVLRNPAEDDPVIAPPEPEKPKVRRVAKRSSRPKKATDSFKVELIQGDRQPETYTFKYDK